MAGEASNSAAGKWKGSPDVPSLALPSFASPAPDPTLLCPSLPPPLPPLGSGPAPEAAAWAAPTHIQLCYQAFKLFKGFYLNFS